MENRHELEYPSPGAEFSAPGGEFTSSGQEFSMPAEVFQGGTSGTGKKNRRKKILYFAATFLIVTNLALPKLPVEPAEPLPAETLPLETQPAQTEPTQAPAQAPTQAPTEPPETLPPTPTYPLGNGTFDITIYNETIDRETWDIRVLYQGSFQEEDFTELLLPEPVTEDGFSFVCFVLCGGKDSSGRSHYYRLQDTVTAEDISLVAPGEDGVRHVKIYAAWQLLEYEEPWMPLTLDANGGTPTLHYDATGPLASGGMTFLCAYPVPERPGYQFAGWYEDPACSGDPVEVLSALAFFEAGENGIDWSASIPITLYARWLPE